MNVSKKDKLRQDLVRLYQRTIDHIVKAVEEAREQAWLTGYEAGQAVASGELKGITWEEAKKRIATPREERKP